MSVQSVMVDVNTSVRTVQDHLPAAVEMAIHWAVMNARAMVSEDNETVTPDWYTVCDYICILRLSPDMVSYCARSHTHTHTALVMHIHVYLHILTLSQV